MVTSLELSTEQVQHELNITPMVKFMGIRLESWDAANDLLTCTMSMRPEFSNMPDFSSFHGGGIATLVDTTTCFAVIGKGFNACSTVNLRVDYLRPAISTSLKCVAKIRRLGRTAAAVDADVFDDAGKLVAIGRCNLVIFQKN